MIQLKWLEEAGMIEKRLLLYRTERGKVPFADWLKKLDLSIRKRIEVYIDKLSLGYLPDCKAVGQGVLEMRVNFGAGFRIYFALHGQEIILLLCGGDKSMQRRDIERAIGYWRDFQGRIS
jgi:putative addiction module killer protein